MLLVVFNGLSKYRVIVASLNLTIVLIKEAAETHEAPIITVYVPSLEYLTLLGIHRQLCPYYQP